MDDQTYLDMELERRLVEAERRLADTRDAVRRLSTEQLAQRVVRFSACRRVSAVVAASGRLEEVAFRGESYRSMPPQELGALVTATVTAAVDDHASALRRELAALLPATIASDGFHRSPLEGAQELLAALDGGGSLDGWLDGLLPQQDGPDWPVGGGSNGAPREGGVR